MFSSTKIRVILGVYIFLVLSIPVGAYLASQNQTIKSSASQAVKKTFTISTPSAIPEEKLSPIDELKLLSEQDTTEASPTPQSSDPPTLSVSFGPTLSIKLSLQGRPGDKQNAKMFVGIIEGAVNTSPKYLLSFTIDLPTSGEFDNISLAGLTPNNTYTAIIKGPAQIATASAFLMSPTKTNLNNGDVVNLLSGDLNEDNMINTADSDIAKSAFGTTPSSTSWNDNIDLNKDGVINNMDLSIILKNQGAVGATGVWSSTPRQESSSSAYLVPDTKAIGGPNNPPSIHPSNQSGYWIWVPK
ncbi:hypothetical protein HYW42_03385 [Candidatus Daviesbacteria bacterium]|nr:hypothetical protein [Candidatus Daviesbacteria bacterium]